MKLNHKYKLMIMVEKLQKVTLYLKCKENKPTVTLYTSQENKPIVTLYTSQEK